MKATSLYNKITISSTSLLLILLFTNDISQLSDKSGIFLLICVFVVLEFLKYLSLSLQFPDVLKTLGTNFALYSNSSQRTSSEKKSKQIIKSVTLFICITFLFQIASILLGAAVVEKFEETFLFSILLCVMTFLPLCLYFGPNSALAALFNVYPKHINSFEATLRQSVYLTLFGAWLGAFVIPLDWDRPWQKWPIPCALGGICGFLISHIVKVPSPQLTKYSV